MSKQSRLIRKLEKVIGKYLDHYVKVPAFQMVRNDFDLQNRLLNILRIFNTSRDYIIRSGEDIDEDHLRELPKDEVLRRLQTLEQFIVEAKTSAVEAPVNTEVRRVLQDGTTNKVLLPYLDREINWVVISILSASYISANILMRSMFELLISLATKKSGSMKDRLEAISYLDPHEKRKLKKLYDLLCSWSHPYKKWLKEICPAYYSFNPTYHPVISKESTENLEVLLGLLLVITLRKFRIDRDVFRKELLDREMNLQRIPFVE